MAIKLRANSLAPIERGIERVVRGPRALTELPEFVDVAPSETLASSRLDQLLALPNIDEFIANALRPQLDSAAILSPGAFRSVLDATVAMLREATVRQPRSARKYGRAARRLSNEAGLRDLLHMYRYALVAG